MFHPVSEEIYDDDHVIDSNPYIISNFKNTLSLNSNHCMIIDFYMISDFCIASSIQPYRGSAKVSKLISYNATVKNF